MVSGIFADDTYFDVLIEYAKNSPEDMLILFYEYFQADNGAGLGASHQTGWTGLVAKLIRQWAEYVGQNHKP